MSSNSRFTIALHILSRMTHSSEDNGRFITSEQIALSVNTNPVFIRRILGTLKKANLVMVQHGGVGAGWKLARNSYEITLLDVYEAVESKLLFEMHRSSPNQQCPIGRGIQPALERCYGNAEAAMRNQLKQETLADLLEETLSFSSK